MTDSIQVVRAVAATPELRADTDESMPELVTRFSVFDTWYEIDSYFEGKFLERTVRGAFADTIRDDRDSIRTLFDHGYDPTIGNKVLAPIEELVEEKSGPVGTGRLLDTSYNRDLLPGLEAGVYGSSFRFRVTGEEWDDEPGPSDSNPNGLPERTITKVRLFEFGPVTFPANPDSTAGVRSLTDQFYNRLRSRDPAAYEDALEARQQSHTFVAGAAARSSAGDEAKPTVGHDLVRRLAAAQRR